MFEDDVRTGFFNGHAAVPGWIPKVQERKVDRLSGSIINKVRVTRHPPCYTC